MRSICSRLAVCGTRFLNVASVTQRYSIILIGKFSAQTTHAATIPQPSLVVQQPGSQKPAEADSTSIGHRRGSLSRWQTPRAQQQLLGVWILELHTRPGANNKTPWACDTRVLVCHTLRRFLL
jgi:hypothetical protein